MRGGRRRRAGWRIASPASSKADRFRSSTDHGAFTAPSLVLATGGLSIPKMGATGFAHDIARRFGLRADRDAARPGAADLRRGAGADAACRSTVVARAAARAASARPCCSPIAACRARRSCRSRPTGARARTITLDLLPDRDAGGVPARSASARGPRPSCAPSWPNCCRSAWRRRWPPRPASDRPTLRDRDLEALGGAAEGAGSSRPPAPRATPRPR